MRRSRSSRGRELETVSGEVVERDVPVARPVARRSSSGLGAPVAREVVVHHVYEAPPGAPVAAPAERPAVPTWLKLVGYLAGLIGLALAIVSLGSGPVIHPPATPPSPAHQHRSHR